MEKFTSRETGDVLPYENRRPLELQGWKFGHSAGDCNYYCNDYFYFPVLVDWASILLFSLILNRRA